MTKKQKDQESMQSSLPEIDRVALTADELKENTKVEHIDLPNLDAEQLKDDLKYDGDAEELKTALVDELQPELRKAAAADRADEAAQEEPKEQTMAEMRVEMMAEIKKELMADLASDHEQKLALAQEERERNAKNREAYVAKMKNSSEPWVDWVSAISDENGVGMELDWNDAYVDFLRANGVTGADDDTVVHKYVTLLLRQGADAIDEEFEDQSKYEG